MVRICVEVCEGSARFKVTVQAESISRAVSITKGRHPDRDVRVVFPIDPEEFFSGIPKETRENGGSRMMLVTDRVR